MKRNEGFAVERASDELGHVLIMPSLLPKAGRTSLTKIVPDTFNCYSFYPPILTECTLVRELTTTGKRISGTGEETKL